jgi:hypothetical protein
MQLDRDEYLLLSRGGRVPRSSRAGPPEPYLVTEAKQRGAGRPARGRRRLTRAVLITVSRARVGGTSRSR